MSPEPNFGRLKSTCNSILHNYGVPMISVVSGSTSIADIKEYKTQCPVFKGLDTITSLINTGFKNAVQPWNMLIMEGTWIKSNIDRKYAGFIESTKDILYSVICDHDIQGKPSNIYSEFWNCSLNGLLIHKDTFTEVGNLNDSPLEESRLIWAYNAVQSGCKFKSILGTKIC